MLYTMELLSNPYMWKNALKALNTYPQERLIEDYPQCTSHPTYLAVDNLLDVWHDVTQEGGEQNFMYVCGEMWAKLLEMSRGFAHSYNPVGSRLLHNRELDEELYHQVHIKIANHSRLFAEYLDNFHDPFHAYLDDPGS